MKTISNISPRKSNLRQYYCVSKLYNIISNVRKYDHSSLHKCESNQEAFSTLSSNFFFRTFVFFVLSVKIFLRILLLYLHSCSNLLFLTFLTSVFFSYILTRKFFPISSSLCRWEYFINSIFLKIVHYQILKIPPF